MTTIHQLKTNLESAEAAYKSADIEHPTAVHLAKEALTSARYEYWNACAELVTRLPDAMRYQWNFIEPRSSLDAIYEEITGEQL